MAWYNPVDMAKGVYGGIKDGVQKFEDWGNTAASLENEFRAVDPNGDLANLGGLGSRAARSGFVNQAGARRQMGGVADMLRRRASGEDSMSEEQLRQGLMQNLSAQRSMAAGASPSNSAMAARNAARNMGNIGSGMAGQAATAGIQERAVAEQQLSQLLNSMRAGDLQTMAQGGNLGLGGYGTIEQQRGNRFNTISGVETNRDKIINMGVGALSSGAGAG